MYLEQFYLKLTSNKKLKYKLFYISKKMNNHIFNYILQHFPLDIIFVLAMANKQIRKRILQSWKKYGYINFRNHFELALAKNRLIDFWEEHFYISNVTYDTLLMKYTLKNGFFREREIIFVHYDFLIQTWKNIQSLEEIDKQHLYMYELLTDNFLYKFKKQKFLKFVFQNSTYDNCISSILGHSLSFGLIDFWKYGISYTNISNKDEFIKKTINSYSPRNMKAYRFYKEYHNATKSGKKISKMNLLQIVDDFEFFVFLYKSKTKDVNQNFFITAACKFNNKIAKYILEKEELKVKFILEINHWFYIDYFHVLGYRFTHEDLPLVFTAEKNIIKHCLTMYRNELISETEDFNKIVSNHYCRCSKIKINNSVVNSIIIHDCGKKYYSNNQKPSIEIIKNEKF